MDIAADFWQNWGGVLRSVGFALLIFGLFWLASQWFYRKLVPFLLKRKTKRKRPVFKQLVNGFKRPFTVYLQFIGLYFSLSYLVGGLSATDLHRTLAAIISHAPDLLSRAMRIGTVIFVTWGLVSSSGITATLLHTARNKLDLKTSKSVTRFLSAVFNVVVVAIATVIILSELSYDINGLIAGLGLGGLTIALAAKDSASNFFGGLVLVTERPFEIGDWISCNAIEGTVEDISLRSTKVRTSSGSLTTVPNSILSGAPITNWSGAMEKRRADFVLNLEYGTGETQLQAFIAESKIVLQDDPDILDDDIVVSFSDFGNSSLDIRVIFYTSLPGFADHIAIKERINYALMSLAAKHGVGFAFPTQTIHLENAAQEDPSKGSAL